MNNGFAQLSSKQSRADEVSVLVAVADDQALMILMKGQRRHEFRLAARLETKMPALPGVEDLFDDFAQLVDLDRKDASVDVAIAHGLDRLGKGLIDGLDTIAQEIVKTHCQGEAELAAFCLRDDLHQIDLWSLDRLGKTTMSPFRFTVKYPSPQRSTL